jgi:hypothetical protein
MGVGGWLLLSCVVAALACAIATRQKGAAHRRVTGGMPADTAGRRTQ